MSSSIWTEVWRILKPTTGTLAGVMRSASRSIRLPAIFTELRTPATPDLLVQLSRLGSGCRLRVGRAFLNSGGRCRRSQRTRLFFLHHWRRSHDSLLRLDGQMTQHCIVELEGVFQFV